MNEFELIPPEKYNELLKSNKAQDLAFLMAADFETKIADQINKLGSKEDLNDFVFGIYYALGQTIKKSFSVIGKTEGNDATHKPKWKSDFWDAARNCGVDHPRDRGEKVVFHPYKLQDYQLENLIDVCKKLNLYMWISGESEYFPAHTIKVNIKPRKEKD